MRAISIFRLTAAVEGNMLVTGMPGSGKTSFIKWSLHDVPPGYSVVIFDTAGEFGGANCSWGRYSVNPLDLPVRRVVEILEESLAATYGEYPYLFTPAMAELLARAVENGARTLSEVSSKVLDIASEHEIDTAYAVRRRMAHFDNPYFAATDLRPEGNICADISELDRVARVAYVLTALELTRSARNVIYVIDEAHRFLAFTSRYSLLIDHLRTGRARGRFFVLVSHSPREFTRHMGYMKAHVRFPDWEEDKAGLKPSEALITIRAASIRAAEALKALGIPLGGTTTQIRMVVPPYVKPTSREGEAPRANGGGAAAGI